ncbi:MAG: ATP synthase F1 subunit delta [Oscillospiraceae bacterium]|nr:ATP synthase F1 subunit delta [Oscillospiraceae bacterium]
MAGISSRYAAALFDLSRESGELDLCAQQAALVLDTLGTEQCRGIIEHPNISGEEKRIFLNSVFGGELHKHLDGFLRLMIVKNREAILVSALTQFIEMYNAFKGKTSASVISATPLDESQVTALKDLLAKKTGKQIDISLRVDPSLIGGLSVLADGFCLDNTVRTQLKEMKNSIMSGEGLDDSQAR